MRLLHSQRGVVSVSVFVSVSLFVFRRCRFLETLWRWAILFDRQLMGCQQANCRAASCISVANCGVQQHATAPQKSVNISGIHCRF